PGHRHRRSAGLAFRPPCGTSPGAHPGRSGPSGRARLDGPAEPRARGRSSDPYREPKAANTMTEQITALVTAVGGIGVGEQILKALVLVGGYRLVACDLDGRTPQFALADASEVLPEAGDPSYLYELFDACERHDVDVVFIGSEAEL